MGQKEHGTKCGPVYWRFAFEGGTSGNVVLEINTCERSPATPLAMREHRVGNPFFSGGTGIPKFQPEEPVTTKPQAPYRRKKGRDLYDLWLAPAVLELDPEAVAVRSPAMRTPSVNSNGARA